MQKGTFLGMLLGTLAASMLGNMLPGKAKVLGQGVIRAAEGVIWAGAGTISRLWIVIPPHLLTNFDMSSYQIEP